MDFLPIKYAAGTLTKWHLLAWLTISLIPLLSLGATPPLERVGDSLMIAIAFGLLYLIAAPLIGQIYGDKFIWSQVWPSVFVVSFLLMVWFCIDRVRTELDFPLSAAIIFLTIGTLWFGICLSLVTWLVPKAAAWSPDQFHKKPWGVSL